MYRTGKALDSRNIMGSLMKGKPKLAFFSSSVDQQFLVAFNTIQCLTISASKGGRSYCVCSSPILGQVRGPVWHDYKWLCTALYIINYVYTYI